MRIIAKRQLREFWTKYPDAEGALEAWHAEAEDGQWKTPADIKKKYGSASVLAGNRMVFNICGGKYRLIVKIHYNTGIIYIRFIGTHAEYDHIKGTRV